MKTRAAGFNGIADITPGDVAEMICGRSPGGVPCAVTSRN
jgi:hypothetical protein